MKHDRAMIPASNDKLREFADIAEFVAHEQASHDQSPCPSMNDMVRDAWNSLGEKRQIIILVALQRIALDACIKYGALLREAATVVTVEQIREDLRA